VGRQARERLPQGPGARRIGVATGVIQVKWRYEFNVKSLLTPPIVWFIANVVWGGYMRKALALAKTQVERSST